ncbi:putative excinuclease ABC subunit C [Magnetofaba australis IT-1]|uniref:UvrABC system protein C n=1 Tax=Magnetofaba australis IT-1 TaxID=1434232 RepID=A0A1Y2K6G7_9PROT|nr:putative excinuclease ABC subunit C [Magnetofaba australis IT-1]
MLYVGKAKQLRKRTLSYFTKNQQSPRIQVMLSLARGLEVTITETESEALILEASLIKKLKPRYNVLLKDDKSYPYLHLSTNHAFPRLSLYRGDRRPPGKYYGPYPSAHAVRETLKWIQKIFPIRQCDDNEFNLRTRPCLQFQIHRCNGPCCDRVSTEEYAALTRDVILFLEGKDKQLTEMLAAAMWSASEERDFEGAKVLRDRIRAIEYVQRQRRVNLAADADMDIAAIELGGGIASAQVFFIRRGVNLGSRGLILEQTGDSDPEEILEQFLQQFYSDKPPPSEVVVDLDLTERAWLENALSERRGQRVTLTRPQRGEKHRLLMLARDNAKQALQRHMSGQEEVRRKLEALTEALNLPQTPDRIEVYDMSHIQDSEAVGAMIVFGPEGFRKNQYRKFNFKDPNLADDTARMAEVLTRRLTRLKNSENEQSEGSGEAWPDLILLDGGQGQLNAVMRVAREMQMDDIAFCGIAKGPERNAGRERLFLPDADEPLILPHDSPALFLLQQIRDEAHRFAIGFHRNKRGKRQIKSALDAIPGVGPRRKKALIARFGSARGVSEASVRELAQTPGVSQTLAETILDALKSDS